LSLRCRHRGYRRIEITINVDEINDGIQDWPVWFIYIKLLAYSTFFLAPDNLDSSGWLAYKCAVGVLNERQRFLKTHTTEIDNVADFAMSSTTWGIPLFSAFSQVLAHGAQQVHVYVIVEVGVLGILEQNGVIKKASFSHSHATRSARRLKVFRDELVGDLQITKQQALEKWDVITPRSADLVHLFTTSEAVLESVVGRYL